MLFSVEGGLLKGHMWNGQFFEAVEVAPAVTVQPGTALVLNEVWSQLYVVSKEGLLTVCHRSADGTWGSVAMLEEPVSQVLAVDEKWQVIYAYSEVRQAILAVHWNGRQWAGEAVVESIGPPGGEGTLDPTGQILYTSHAHFSSTLAPVDSCEAPLGLPAWPVVATWWDGAAWRSRVVAETGVPQRPAWDPRQKRLYFAVWNQPEALRVIELGSPRAQLAAAGTGIQPLNPRKTSKGGLAAGWVPFASGLPTWVDQAIHPIDYDAVTKYRKGFGGGSGVVVTVPPLPKPAPTLPSDQWVLLAAYVPEWASSTMPERVSSWSGVVSPTRRELLHQTSLHHGGSLRVATGWKSVPELYGVYPRQGFQADQNPDPADFGYFGYFLWTPDWHDEIPADVLPRVTTQVGGKILPKPSVFRTEFLTKDWSLPTDIDLGQVGEKAKSHFSDSAMMLVSSDVVRDPSLPLPPPRLADAESSVRTFGARLASQTNEAAPGGRFRNYPTTAANRSWAGGLAADRRGTFVFYTQAPDVRVTPRPPGGRMTISSNVGAVDYDASADVPSLVSEGPVWVSVLFSRP